MVAPGDPLNSRTWSGSSAFLAAALNRHGAEVVPVDGRPAVANRLEMLASISRSRARWRQTFHSRTGPFSPLARAWWTRHAIRELRRVEGKLDAVLQIGAWYDVTAYARAVGLMSASYNDANLSTYLAHPGLDISPSSSNVRRAMRHERDVSRRLDMILCMSDWVSDAFTRDYGEPPAKVRTVLAGANLADVPDPPGNRAPGLRVLFVGKGDFERKGGHDLLMAFRAVRDQVKDASLWIVGQDGQDEPGVRFFGFINRNQAGGEALLARLYNTATVYAMPSHYEPFGIAFLEAMAHGLPCIGTDTCAMPEIIDNGVTGYVVPVRDVGALTSRILQLARDQRSASRMGLAGRTRMLDRFTWDAVAATIIAALGEGRDGNCFSTATIHS